MLITLLGYLALFDIVFILTNGGPNDSTVTLTLYAYRAYINNAWGYASAVGVVIVRRRAATDRRRAAPVPASGSGRL